MMPNRSHCGLRFLYDCSALEFALYPPQGPQHDWFESRITNGWRTRCGQQRIISS